MLDDLHYIWSVLRILLKASETNISNVILAQVSFATFVIKRFSYLIDHVLRDEVIEILRPVGGSVDGRRWIMDYLEESACRMHVLEGCLIIGQLYCCDADRPYVDPVIVFAISLVAAFDNFRRHPGRRAYASMSFLEFVLQHSGEPKIDQFHFTFFR